MIHERPAERARHENAPMRWGFRPTPSAQTPPLASTSSRMDAMCGRYADAREEEVVETFGITQVLGDLPRSANVAPTQSVRIVRDVPPDAAGLTVRQLRSARWGLLPSWVKSVGRPLINARCETVTVKPSFRAAAGRRRAIVPASGYYEWALQPDGAKLPLFLHSPDQPVLGFAGLYEWWRLPAGVTMPGSEDGWLCSTVIITRAATDALGHIHDRMPVVVGPQFVDAWLDRTITRGSDVDELLSAMGDPVLVPTAVSLPPLS